MHIVQRQAPGLKILLRPQLRQIGLANTLRENTQMAHGGSAQPVFRHRERASIFVGALARRAGDAPGLAARHRLARDMEKHMRHEGQQRSRRRQIGAVLVALVGMVVAIPAAAPGAFHVHRSGDGEVFTDGITGFTVVKPQGWFMEGGKQLYDRAREEARRLGDPSLGAAPEGAPRESLVRITRYAPGRAPGPNPTIVITRFDLQRHRPGTTADDLLRMGLATAQIEQGPMTVTLGDRPWRKLTGTRVFSHPAGHSVTARQEVYVAPAGRWAIGLVITMPQDQYEEYRAALDALLDSIHFR